MAWFDLADGVVQADKERARYLLRDDLRALHSAGHKVHVRISAATPEADLDAAVWPGLTTTTVSKAESEEAVRLIDELLDELEQRRGLRPGKVSLELAIETPLGVQRVHQLAGGRLRVGGISLGDGMTLAVHLGATSQQSSALAYARGECMLASLVAGLTAPREPGYDRLSDLEPERRVEEPIRV